MLWNVECALIATAELSDPPLFQLLTVFFLSDIQSAARFININLVTILAKLLQVTPVLSKGDLLS